MGTPSPRALTLDAGALIALERQSVAVAGLLRQAMQEGVPLAVPTGVVGQVWRDGGRSARVAALLKEPLVEVVPLDLLTAKAAALLCRAAGTTDVVDASVAHCAARRSGRVLTSDAGDLRRLDPRLVLVEC